MEILKKYYVEEQRAELEYLCSGDADLYCRKKEEIRQAARTAVDLSQFRHVQKSQYNLTLNYVGNQSLLHQIDCIEKQFLPIRKTVSKEEYQEQFQKLFRLRNQFAKSAGFADYLEYQYTLLGIDAEILDQILETTVRHHYSEKSLLREKIQQWRHSVCLQPENQIALLKKVLDYFNLQIAWEKVQIHHENLPQFYIGNCISINVPDEIHVLINKVAGLSGFSILMHEIGHAYYYNNIRQSGPEWADRPYNAVVEEFVALVFEDLVYSAQFLGTFLDSDEDLLSDKLNFQMNYLCCCALFEKNIYSKDMPDFDREWEMACEKFSVSRDKEWRSPHFFISYPGFFAVDVMAGFLTKRFYEQIGNDYTAINNYLQKQICEPGFHLDFYRVIRQLIL